MTRARRDGPYATMAESYYDLGLSPIPVREKDSGRKKAKAPYDPGFTGREGAWPNGDDIDRWMERYPQANIAIRLPINVICLDVDDYDGHEGGATLERIEGELGKLPDTVRSSARWDEGISGIRWYTIPDDYLDVEWPSHAGPGIDVLAWYERYAIVPPSVHANGKQYRWYLEADDTFIAKLETVDFPGLPAAWCEYLARNPAHDEVDYSVNVQEWLEEHGQGKPCDFMADTYEEAIGELAEAKDGGGIHDLTASLAYRLVGNAAQRHSGALEALKALREAFMELVSARDRGRRNEAREEWKRILDTAVYKKAGGVIDQDDPCVTEASANGGVNPAKAAQAAKLLEGMHDGAWLNKQVFPPLRYAVPELLPEGLTLLVGPPKVGKSVLLLRVGLETARAGEVFGLQAEGMQVFYLALEDSDRRMQARADELLGGGEIPADFTYQTEIKPGRLIETVAAWLGKAGRGLVLIDTLGRALEPARNGETTYERDYRIMNSLKQTADAHDGSSVVVSHHAKKGKSEDWLETVSGTNAIAGSADTIIMLNRARTEQDGLLRIAGRDVEEAEYAVTKQDHVGWQLDGDSLEDAAGRAAARKADGSIDRRRDSTRADKIVAYVEDNEDGVNRENVATELDISASVASVMLARLAKSGRIAVLSRGLYGPSAKQNVSGASPRARVHTRGRTRGRA